MDDISLQYNTNGAIPCQYITRIEAAIANNNYDIDYINKITNTIIDDLVSQLSEINKNIRENVYKVSSFDNVRDVMRTAKLLSNDFVNYSNIVNCYKQIDSIVVVAKYSDDSRCRELQSIIDNHKAILFKLLNLIANTYKSLFSDVDKRYRSLNSNSKELILNTVKKIVAIECSEPSHLQEGAIGDALEKGFGLVTSFLSKILDHWVLTIGSFIGIYCISNSEFLAGLFNFLDPIFGFLKAIPIAMVMSIVLFTGICVALWIYHRVRDQTNRNKNFQLNKQLDLIKQRHSLMDKNGAQRFGDTENGTVSITSTKHVPPENNDNQTFRGFNNTVGYRPKQNTSTENDKFGVFS